MVADQEKAKAPSILSSANEPKLWPHPLRPQSLSISTLYASGSANTHTISSDRRSHSIFSFVISVQLSLWRSTVPSNLYIVVHSIHWPHPVVIFFFPFLFFFFFSSFFSFSLLRPFFATLARSDYFDIATRLFDIAVAAASSWPQGSPWVFSVS
jgi:hypothetical protein